MFEGGTYFDQSKVQRMTFAFCIAKLDSVSSTMTHLLVTLHHYLTATAGEATTFMNSKYSDTSCLVVEMHYAAE